jgi:uncharacterized protein YkwD
MSAHPNPQSTPTLKLLLIMLLLYCSSQAALAQTGPSAQEILNEVNLLRTQPDQYAEIVASERQYYHDMIYQKPGEIRIRVKEGVTALDEAVKFLHNQSAVGPLQLSHGLSLGANDHVQDQSKSGKTGHQGADGTYVKDRINRYGISNGCGENLAYGPSTARDIVVQLVIDDGVPDRGHRTNFFTPEWSFFGSACGPHPNFRMMCAIAMAAHYSEDPTRQHALPVSSKRPTSNSTTAAAADYTKGPAPRTGNNYRDARASADGCLRCAVNQDFSALRNYLTPAAKASLSVLQGRLTREAKDGWVYQFASSETVGSSFVRFRYLRKNGTRSEPFFVSLFLTQDRWLVDEISL